MTSNNVHYTKQFKQYQATLSESAWLDNYRQQAFENFTGTGFPTRQLEDWKYTDIQFIADNDYQILGGKSTISKEEIDSHQLNPDYNLLVFVDGVYSPALSNLKDLPQNSVLTSLSSAIQDQELQKYIGKQLQFAPANLMAFNSAFMQDGLFLKMPDNVVYETPIHLLFISSGDEQTKTMHHTRNLFLIGNNSAATVIEHYVGINDNAYFTTSVNEVVLQDNAQLQHFKLQQEGKKAFHIGHTDILQQHNSHFNSFNIDLGGKLVRNDIKAILNAEGCGCTLSGLYMAKDRQHIDNHTRVEHAKPNSNSYEYYKGILDDRGRAVFNGKVIVEKDAQKSSAHQSNKNLLLSKKAEVDTKPQLEIFADDVQCSHGATVGQLDEKALFYLQSRGIDKETAQAALTYGFAKDLINQIQLSSVREKLDALLIERLPHGNKIKELL